MALTSDVSASASPTSTVVKTSTPCASSAPNGARSLGLEVEVRQTDDEAEMVHWMHQAADEKTPVVMNPAAFTHYSYALADAAHMVIDENLPLMEVHISNPSARDEFRKRSVISPVATGTITGMGFYGYKLALDAVAHLLSE